MSTLDDLYAQYWTDRNKALLKQWLGTLIRSALLSLGSWLKATGKFPFLSDGVIAQAANYAPQLAGDVIIAIPIIWGLIQKWNADRKLKTALVMPPESTQADLHTVMKTTSPGIIATSEIPTPAQAAVILNDSKP